MSFISNIAAKLPFAKKDEVLEHFFALNIDPEKITAAVWTIEAGRLKILGKSSTDYSSADDLLPATDKVLDAALGEAIFEPDKILFGVSDSWLSEDNLKEEYLNLLRKIVKELELKPMAYVATSHALAHFLEKQEGAPITAILIGIGQNDLTVSVLKAGKLDGSKVLQRGEVIGQDVEKALLSFTEIEVLPSKILIYGSSDLEKTKGELLSFPWMQRLSFLHFPKINALEPDVEVKAISFAGAIELDPHIKFVADKSELVSAAVPLKNELAEEDLKEVGLEQDLSSGFVAGDVLEQMTAEKDIGKDQDLDEGVGEPALSEAQRESIESDNIDAFGQRSDHVMSEPTELQNRQTNLAENDDQYFKSEVPESGSSTLSTSKSPLHNILKGFKGKPFIIGPVLLLVFLIAAYLFLLKATVMVYVEPKVLEKDTQVTADPTIKSVDEVGKKIPGEIVETTVNGSDKQAATGKKQIGDPAKGTVTVYNKTYNQVSLSSGIVITGSGQKFTLDTSVKIASQSASDSGITFGKTSVNVTAVNIGADGNLPSGTEMLVAGFSTDQVSAKAEGNFSGGTSKDATVVSDDDQKKLLATVASALRKKAQQELQSKHPGKKVLEEALAENITKKSFNKRVGDQASEFSLDLTIRYKGTAYSDEDLRTIVSKLVETNVPQDFQLNLADTETQADVSKIESNGQLIFLARFKAKLMPKIDTDKIKKQLRGLTISQATEVLKGYDNVLGSEIKTNLPIPINLQRLPILESNIKVETGLK